MYQFSEFKIKTEANPFIGDSIQIAKLFNTEITVINFKISPSIKKDNSNCLTIQIEKQGVKRVIFTGSTCLMEQIKQVPENNFPFTTKIVMGDNDKYEFT